MAMVLPRYCKLYLFFYLIFINDKIKTSNAILYAAFDVFLLYKKRFRAMAGTV